MAPLFSHGKKKRYVGKVIWPKEDMIVRGYEIRRTDSFDMQSETLGMVFEEILSDNIKVAISKSREIIDKLLKGDVPKEKLVISRSVKEAIGKPMFKFGLGGEGTMLDFRIDQTVASAFRRNGLNINPSADRAVPVSPGFAYIVKDDENNTSYLLQKSGNTVTVYKSSTIYKNPERMTNVQAAIKFIDLGYEFVPGMKVSWIVINSKRTPQLVDPYIDGKKFEKEPDWQYYAKRVAATVARVTEVFDWDEDALLTGTQQQTLFGGKFGGKKKDDTAKPNVTKKQVSLEDFM
jgi:DNA polymerase elongation subunit (family B)